MKDFASELGRRPRVSMWSRFNMFLGMVLAAGLIVVLTYRNLPWVKEKAAQDDRADKLQEQLDLAVMMHQRLSREVNALQTNPDLLAVYARDRVFPGYMKGGEIIYRIEKTDAQQRR